MELCNFTSLFEIFCTIYLAYVITDNYSESNFIATITEKILRKYQNIDSLFEEINEKILGSETSLNTLEIPKAKENDIPQKIEEYEKQLKLRTQSFEILVIQKKKIAQSKKEIYSQIRNSYQTKSFSFISLYLALYCILILIYSGICQSLQNSNIVNSLLALNIFSFLFIIFGWAYDGNEINSNQKGFTNKFVKFITRKLNINGYVFTLIAIAFAIILSFASYFISQHQTENYNYYHNSIVIFTILLPILNFWVYFKKAANRAAKITDSLTEQVSSIATEVPNDLQDIEDFITYFKVDKKIKIQQV